MDEHNLSRRPLTNNPKTLPTPRLGIAGRTVSQRIWLIDKRYRCVSVFETAQEARRAPLEARQGGGR
jgi:hypothetical protein